MGIIRKCIVTRCLHLFLLLASFPLKQIWRGCLFLLNYCPAWTYNYRVLTMRGSLKLFLTNGERDEKSSCSSLKILLYWENTVRVMNIVPLNNFHMFQENQGGGWTMTAKLFDTPFFPAMIIICQSHFFQTKKRRMVFRHFSNPWSNGRIYNKSN